jgi:hypothetical protein
MNENVKRTCLLNGGGRKTRKKRAGLCKRNATASSKTGIIMSYSWNVGSGQSRDNSGKESNQLGSASVEVPLTPPSVRNVSISTCLSIVQFRGAFTIVGAKATHLLHCMLYQLLVADKSNSSITKFCSPNARVQVAR